jgi:hypothetical protein
MSFAPYQRPQAGGLNAAGRAAPLILFPISY